MRYSKKVTPISKLHLLILSPVTCVTSVTLSYKSACRAISQKLHFSLSHCKISNFYNQVTLKVAVKLQLVTRCNFHRLACKAVLDGVGYRSYTSDTFYGCNFLAESEVK